MIGSSWVFSMLSLRFIDIGGETGWAVSASFVDAGFVNDNSDTHQISTEGSLSSRYMIKDSSNGTSGAVIALNVIRADLSRLGVKSTPNIRPLIFVSNREDIELNLKDVTLPEMISGEDIIAIRNYAQIHNFDVQGI